MRTLILFTVISFLISNCTSSKKEEQKFFEKESSDPPVDGDTIYVENETKFSKISPLQLNQLLSLDKAYVIDCRNSEQFSRGRIINSLCFDPEEMNRNEEKLKDLDVTHTFYLYGANEKDSENIAKWLVKKGVNNLYLLNGGFTAWEQAQLPVIH